MNFNLTTINSGFSGLVGMRQTIDANYPQLDADIIESESGLYIDDHGLLTIENLYSLAPNFGDMELGSGVTVADAFNDWLRQRIQQSQAKLLNKLFTLKKGLGQSKELYEDFRLFDNTRDMTKVVSNAGDFVGLEITFGKFDGMALQITRIGTHFNDEVTVPIYIFQSGKIDYVTRTEINHDTANSYKWTDFNHKLYYNSDTLLPGGTYYIGYFQDDLGEAKAIRQDINFNNLCYGCSYYNRLWHQKYSRYMVVSNAKVASSNLNGTDYWKREEYVQRGSDNYGINLDCAVVSDLTPFFLKNKNVLAYPLKLQIQVDLISEMYSSNRDTWLKSDLRRRIELEMNGENKGSLMSEYYYALKALDFDYSGLGTFALNSNKRGVRMRPI